MSKGNGSCSSSKPDSAFRTKEAPPVGGGARTTRRMALVVTLSALAVVLSPLNIPIGDAKAFPIQHTVNVVAAVLLGPWYAVLVALIVGTIRIGLGMGTIFAYPGGAFGGLVVGLLYRYVRRSDLAAFAEPIGTVPIGATLSGLLIAPMLGKTMTVAYFWAAFAVSCIPGAILGFVVLKTLRRVRLDGYFA